MFIRCLAAVVLLVATCASLPARADFTSGPLTCSFDPPSEIYLSGGQPIIIRSVDGKGKERWYVGTGSDKPLPRVRVPPKKESVRYLNFGSVHCVFRVPSEVVGYKLELLVDTPAHKKSRVTYCTATACRRVDATIMEISAAQAQKLLP